MSVEVDQEAPDFELPDQHRKPVRLSDYRGSKNVMVVFYPLAFTRVCEGEMCDLRDDLTSWQNEDASLLAVSVDSPATLKKWAEEQGFDFPMLSDFWPHGEVARRYGVFDEGMGVALRGTFIIDREGIVRWKTVNNVPDARDQEEYKKVLAAIA